jgi:hypothetical protein
LNEKRLLFRARAGAGTLFHALNLEIQFPVMDLIGSGGLLSEADFRNLSNTRHVQSSMMALLLLLLLMGRTLAVMGALWV